jgi:hypothetical protein
MGPGDQVVLSLFDQTQVYLARDPVDMRKQIDGLALIVQEVFELAPFQPALFAFCNIDHGVGPSQPTEPRSLSSQNIPI